MSLLKLPFTALFAYCFHAALCPPQPPAAKKEQKATSALDVPSLTLWRVHLSLLWQGLSSVIEITTIIILNTPSVSGPIHPFLKALLPKARQDDLYLNFSSIAGLLCVILAATIRLSSFKFLGRFFRYQVSIQKDHQLITSGPYSIVRHPGYTGIIFEVIGWFLWNYADGSWLRHSRLLESFWGLIFMSLFSTVGMLGHMGVTLGRMKMEDAALREQFGKEWDDWAKRVPYSVIPGVY